MAATRNLDHPVCSEHLKKPVDCGAPTTPDLSPNLRWCLRVDYPLSHNVWRSFARNNRRVEPTGRRPAAILAVCGRYHHRKSFVIGPSRHIAAENRASSHKPRSPRSIFLQANPCGLLARGEACIEWAARPRGIAQSGSAGVLGTPGRRFKSGCPDHARWEAQPQAWTARHQHRKRVFLKIAGAEPPPKRTNHGSTHLQASEDCDAVG